MSTTPKTDEAIILCLSQEMNQPDYEHVEASFARDLETALASSEAQCAVMRKFIEKVPTANWRYIESGDMATEATSLLSASDAGKQLLERCRKMEAHAEAMCLALECSYDARDYPADGTSSQERAAAAFREEFSSPSAEAINPKRP